MQEEIESYCIVGYFLKWHACLPSQEYLIQTVSSGVRNVSVLINKYALEGTYSNTCIAEQSLALAIASLSVVEFQKCLFLKIGLLMLKCPSRARYEHLDTCIWDVDKHFTPAFTCSQIISVSRDGQWFLHLLDELCPVHQE